MLHILTARAGSGQLDIILKRMGAGTGKQILIVPEQYSHETERAMCHALSPTDCARCEVLSFTRLSRRVAETVGGVADQMLDGGGRVLLMYKAVRQVTEHLMVYKTPSRKPSFLAGLVATVDECKSYGVSPQALMEAGETVGGGEGAKLRDIGLIYGAYIALTARAAADPRDRLDKLSENLMASNWATGKDFWVWGFTDFTAQDGKVLRALMVKGDSLTVALTMDAEDQDPSDIFGPARRTVAYLRRLAESAGVQINRESLPYCSRRVPSLTHLEQNLFALHPPVWMEDSGVTVISAPDPRWEAEWTAAEILRLVREEGYRFREIALCVRGFEGSSALLESVCTRYGVPLFFSAVTDILQKPILALVTATLDCAAGGYATEDVLRCLKTGLTGLCEDERDELENYVLTWDIRGSRWTREAPWNMHPAGYGRDWTEEDRALVERLDGLRRKLIAPMEKLRMAQSTGKGYAMALYRCLEEMDVPQRLEDRANQLEERGDLQRAAEYRQLWEILCGGLEQCALLLGEESMELDEFSRLFQLVLSQYDVSAIPVSLDRVTAGDCTRMAGKQVRALFLLGADSNKIPRASPAPGLFSDHDRGLLAEQNLTLAPRMEDKLRREMTIVYETCAVPTERLYVSWAVAGSSGEERSPSFLIERLKAIFPQVEQVNGGKIPLCAPLPALERVGEEPAAAAALRAIPQWQEAVARVEQARAWRRGRLTRLGTEALYGASVAFSATKLDQLASCHFSHFLRYGLEIKHRERAKFQATDYGTFLHFILEQVLSEAMKTPEGLQKLIESEQWRRQETIRAAQLYVEQSLQDVEEETGRFRYLFRRMCRASEQVVDHAVAELAVSEFRPVAFELSFGRGGALPAITVKNGITVRLSGFVDRVDLWRQDGTCYLRVVDYKTGKKAFDYTDIQNGIGLQMLLYLFTLTKKGKVLFGEDEIVPTGVLYFPARNPIVDGKRSMTPKEIQAAVDRELKRKGLILADSQVIDAMEQSTDGTYRFLPLGSRDNSVISAPQMERLAQLVQDKLKEAAGQLAEGNIDADPYWRGEDQNACRWCEYAAACLFEPACGDKVRRQRALQSGEFWAALQVNTEEEEEEEHGI